MHDGPPGLPRPPGATRYGDRRRPSPERSEMSEDEDRINRIAAEQMLSTTWVGWGVGSDPLAELLAAHAAATREDQRVEAVRGAHRSTGRATRKRSIVQVAIARLATAKAVVALVALGGGAALAASTGHMPGLGSSGNDHGARLPAEITAGAPDSSPGGDLTSTGGSPSAWPSTSVQPSATPPANVRNLCVSIDAARGATRATALDDPAYAVLITAAGGKDEVAGYCAAVLGARPGTSSAQPGDPSSDQPPSTLPSSPAGSPTPTGPPSTTPPPSPTRTHPTGPPSTHPSGPAGTRPSGRT
jgi:hypothetical protein